MKELPQGFEKRVVTSPPFNRKAEGYGIGSGEMRFHLIGPKGAVQFVCLTGVYTDDVDTSSWEPWMKQPSAMDLGYHSPKPRYDGQKRMPKCELLGEDACYYDGSTLNAEPVLQRFLAEGEEGVWDELLRYYFAVFEEGAPGGFGAFIAALRDAVEERDR